MASSASNSWEPYLAQDGPWVVVVVVRGKLPTRPPVFSIPCCLKVPLLSAPSPLGLAFSVVYLGRLVCLLSDKCPPCWLESTLSSQEIPCQSRASVGKFNRVLRLFLN